MSKKDFSKAVTNAADKFFSIPTPEKAKESANNYTQPLIDANNYEDPNDINNKNNYNDENKTINVEEANNIKNTNNINNTDDANDTDITDNTEKDNNDNNINITDKTKPSNNKNVKNKSKHYDERGKREERYGLLLDKQLKEDLKSLANAYGSRSINDFIVTILLEYVESSNNQKILEAYGQLEKLKNM